MVKLSETAIREHGLLWVFEFTGLEMEEKRCNICGKPFNEEQKAFLCEICKQVYHESCFFELKRSRKTPCNHTMEEQFQYFSGTIKVI